MNLNVACGPAVVFFAPLPARQNRTGTAGSVGLYARNGERHDHQHKQQWLALFSSDPVDVDTGPDARAMIDGCPSCHK
jgi:hypothetical protein